MCGFRFSAVLELEYLLIRTLEIPDGRISRDMHTCAVMT